MESFITMLCCTRQWVGKSFGAMLYRMGYQGGGGGLGIGKILHNNSVPNCAMVF